MDHTYLDKNLADIRRRIAAAAERSGRRAEEITLLSAIKSADVDEINYVHRALGVNDVGENRVNQLTERWDKLDREGLNMHFIGSLQTNKVKYIIDKVALIHSLDSLSLAREIDKRAKQHDLVADVLVEINSGSEENKGGIAYGAAADFCLALGEYENIRLRGFMTMAPRCETAEEYRPYFTQTRAVAEEVWYGVLGHTDAPVLSMGMSESFEMAIECGANMVRVGRSMFAKAEEPEGSH